MSESSEEKSDPASDKKLNDARKKGQVASSKDFVSAMGLLFSLGGLLAMADMITGRLSQSLVLAVDVISSSAADTTMLRSGLAQLGPGLVMTTVLATVPLLVLSVFGAVMASLLMQKGFIFSLEPMTPKFDKLNPFTGIKNLFKMKALIELIKSVLKAVILTVAFTVVVMGALSSIVHVPNCGFGCVAPVLERLSLIVIAIALAFTLVIGAVDILLQNHLFLQEMKMTKTEVKKEGEDQNGKPEIKGEQNRIRQEANEGVRPTMDNATLVVFGNGVTVGLRYVSGETGVPMVMAKGANEKGGALLASAYGANLALYEDAGLAEMLLKKVPLGQEIRREQFDRVARAIQGARQPGG